MKKIPHFLALTTTTVLFCCNGTETDNPVAEEPSAPWLSECKTQNTTAFTSSSWFGTTSQALTSQETMLPAALACVSWSLDENNLLSVELNSFRGGCGTDFEARSNIADGSITLGIYNPPCRIAACGSCLYDSRFEAQLASNDDQDFALTQHGCEDQETGRVEWTLPLSSEPSGTICEFADGWGLSKVAQAQDLVGKAFGPCLEETNTCEGDDLACIAPHGGELGTFNTLCMPRCQVDTDCPLSDVLLCDESVCKPRGR